MINYIRRLILKFLGIDNIIQKFMQENDKLRKENKKLSKQIDNIDNICGETIANVNCSLDGQNRRLSDIENGFKIALDVSPTQPGRGDPSWGVICYTANKQDYVRFLDLSFMSPDQIKHEFVDRFRNMDKKIDTPVGMRNMFKFNF